MNRLIAGVIGALALGAAEAATIQQVIVRQQWPWSTDIKVEYQLMGVDTEHPVNIGVEAYNGSVKLDSARLEQSITGDRYGICESGVGQFVINPVTAFGQEKVALANFKVKLTLTDSDQNASEVIYKIFDLENTDADGHFLCTDVTRADIKNKHYGDFETDYNQIATAANSSVLDPLIWTGVTNNIAYKTTKLVLRKIPAGTFQMGQTGGAFGTSGNAEQVHSVTLTKNYWIGVFPVTQMQYKKLTKGNWDGNGLKGDARPAENALFSAFREVVNGTISNNMNLSVDFPTEAQWECACRAGTTTELYTGKGLSSDNLDPIAWIAANAESTTHDVGLKLPNAYGLYDMLGNVYEACADYWTAATNAPGYSSGTAVTDPYVDTVQPDTPKTENGTTYNRLVMRGGYYLIATTDVTSAGRNGSYGNWTAYGFRLCYTED